MSIPQWISIVIPTPRRRVTLLSALPLILFLAAFVAACILLELRHVIMFASPGAFLLTASVPWLWWMHVAGMGGLTGVRSVLAIVIRLLLAGALIMLLAEPRAVRRSDELSVVYCLDVSDSIGESASDAALGYMLDTVGGKPARDRAGLVVFGRNAAVELPPRAGFPYEAKSMAINSRVAKDGTNLEKALSLAAAVLPQDTDGRIVLISDGAATEGNLSAVLGELEARRIRVDVLPIDYDYGKEVWLEKIELPRSVRAGETYEASVILSALKPGRGTLRLFENGVLAHEEEVEFAAGKNRYTLPFYLRDPGYYEYEATIEMAAGEDGWPQNNRAVGHVFLRGEGRVLLVTDPEGEPEDSRPLLEALKAGKIMVSRMSAYELPTDPLSLLPYDCVIFVNVPADALDVMQMQAVRDAVYNQGVGFLMVGGKNSFGPGGYHRTPVEEALPVSMDITHKKVLPKGALVIILHTCEFAQGNTWGKRITKEAIRVLSARDEVGVLAYDYTSGEGWVFPLTPAGQYQRLMRKINNAEIGDMPAFGPTMKQGLDALKASDAAIKHMIIISDGDPAPPTPGLLKEFQDAGVSVSTVPIYPHLGQDTAVMTEIARATGGTPYPKQMDPSRLPSIFIKEAKTLRRTMIQNKDFVPTVTFPSPILKGIDDMPELHGYVLTSAKPHHSTRVVLKGPEEEEVDPVLAVWHHGVGKAAAFTSDLTTKWAKDWVGWARYRAFVKQLVVDISRAERESNLDLRTYAAGGTGIIAVEDTHPQERLMDLTALVQGPRDQSEQVELEQVGPRRYEGRFPLWGTGRYQVAAVGEGEGRSERAVGGFAVPYSAEYLRFRSDPIALKQIRETTGGRELTGGEGPRDIFVQDRTPRSSDRPVADLFLILVACLVPLDVAVRRVQPDIALIRRWLRLDRRVESVRTLGALLQRKRELRLERREDREGEPLPRPAPTVSRPPAARPPQPPPERKLEGEPAEGEATTTGRLLELKRRWKKEDEEDE